MSDPEKAVSEELCAVRERPGGKGVLPCGSRVCLRCHKQCGVVMAAYLGGLNEMTEETEPE